MQLLLAVMVLATYGTIWSEGVTGILESHDLLNHFGKLRELKEI